MPLETWRLQSSTLPLRTWNPRPRGGHWNDLRFNRVAVTPQDLQDDFPSWLLLKQEASLPAAALLWREQSLFNWSSQPIISRRAIASPAVSLVPRYNVDILRHASRLFFVLLLSGLLLMSLATGAFASLLAGIGMAALWTGCLVIVAAFYVHGLQSGDFLLLSPRMSITALVAFFGLVMTSIIAAVEFTVQ